MLEKVPTRKGRVFSSPLHLSRCLPPSRSEPPPSPPPFLLHTYRHAKRKNNFTASAAAVASRSCN